MEFKNINYTINQNDSQGFGQQTMLSIDNKLRQNNAALQIET